MATIHKRRMATVAPAGDATVSVMGYPRTGKTFRSKLAAELWASRLEAARQGRALLSARRMTIGHLLDNALPRLTIPPPLCSPIGGKNSAMCGSIRSLPD
jgi:hypothetical protein